MDRFAVERVKLHALFAVTEGHQDAAQPLDAGVRHGDAPPYGGAAQVFPLQYGLQGAFQKVRLQSISIHQVGQQGVDRVLPLLRFQVKANGFVAQIVHQRHVSTPESLNLNPLRANGKARSGGNRRATPGAFSLCGLSVCRDAA